MKLSINCLHSQYNFVFCRNNVSVSQRMPRPKNNTLRELFFDADNPTDVCCSNGNCGGRKLSDRAGNLERHLRIMHPQLYTAYMEQKGAPLPKKVETDPYIIKFSCEINTKNMEMAIVELFTKCGLALHVIEDRAFKTLLKPVLDCLKMGATVDNLIEKIVALSEKVKDNTIEELKGKLLSLKVDLVTRQNGSCFVGVNVQYVKSHSIIVRMLSIKQFMQKPTNEHLIPLLLEITDEYEFGTNQIMTITIDNGADMVKTVSCPKSPLYDGITINNRSEEMLDLTGTLFSTPVIANIQCCTHALNLCIENVLQSARICQQIEKWRDIVKTIESQHYRDIMQKCGYKTPLMDCPTKWNTTYDMLEALFELKDMIKTDSLSDKPAFLISHDDWKFIDNCLNVLKICLNAIIKLQSEVLCYSDFYIGMMDILLKLGNLPRSDIQVFMIEALNGEKSKQMESDLFISAVFLDPRVRVTLTTGQVVRAKHFIGLFNERMNALNEKNPSLIEEVIKQEAEEPSSSTQAPQTLDELLQTLDTSASNVGVQMFFNTPEVKLEDDAPSSSCPAVKTFEEFLPMQNVEIDMLLYDRQQRMRLTDNILEYWSQQNNSLSCLAETVLSIPCTRVSMERLLLALDYILSNESEMVEAQHLEHILLLRANKPFSYEFT